MTRALRENVLLYLFLLLLSFSSSSSIVKSIANARSIEVNTFLSMAFFSVRRSTKIPTSLKYMKASPNRASICSFYRDLSHAGNARDRSESKDNRTRRENLTRGYDRNFVIFVRSLAECFHRHMRADRQGQ